MVNESPDLVTVKTLPAIVLDEILGSPFSAQSDIWHYIGSNFSQMSNNEIKFTNVLYNLHFKRKYQYYFNSIFIPMLLLLSLQIFGLFIDPETPAERIVYTVTIVLAFQFSNDQFTRDIPHTSQKVMIFDYILFISFVASSIALYAIVAGILVRFEWFLKSRRIWKYQLLSIRITDLFMGITATVAVGVTTMVFYFSI